MGFTQYISLNRNLSVWIFPSKPEELEYFSLSTELTVRSPSCIAALLILFLSLPPVVSCVEENRHFLCSLQVNLSRTSFSWKVSLSVLISLRVLSFLLLFHKYTWVAFRWNSLKAFENVMLGRSLGDEILNKLITDLLYSCANILHITQNSTHRKSVRDK